MGPKAGKWTGQHTLRGFFILKDCVLVPAREDRAPGDLGVRHSHSQVCRLIEVNSLPWPYTFPQFASSNYLLWCTALKCYCRALTSVRTMRLDIRGKKHHLLFP